MTTVSTKGGIISAKKNKPQGLQSFIKAMEPQIAKALPSVLTPERFTRMVLTAISSNPQLKECTPSSFLGAMMQAAQLGVEPNTPLGQAYLIPYKNKNKLECQFQLGYKGLIDLAYRSGEITDISAHAVYENDQFEYELGLTPKLKHIPALENRGDVILYYAVFHTKNGGYGFEVMSKADVMEYMHKFSKASGSKFSPWSTNFDSMAKKTVIKKVLKYAPIKTEFVRQVTADETIKSTLSEDMLYEQNEINITEEAEQNDSKEEEPTTVDSETGEIIE